VQNVTDRVSNPFGMRPPVVDGREAAVFGYGDANADVHVVGDYPGVHGGAGQRVGARDTAAPADGTGVPFTETLAGERLQGVLHAVGLLEEAYSDEPVVSNLFVSYLHMSVTEGGRRPTPAEYDRLEPYFDAELRAIAAHVLVPVGERATRHILEQYTSRAHAVESAAAAHATEVRGRGFLVVPVKEPHDWGPEDADALVETLSGVLERDYRQISDLGRFEPGSDPYFVR
jgi:uracil-DNA glycosylase family 4